ncbi:hypothetical protein [Nocardia vaccinii]|uniref:hypothetical protein n=1 Tax=Nocardia vaccinii TaxID=1822 RepID=UPI00082E34DD|nr:hypothetical protein [Nocardia vaccinii]
MVVVVDVSGGDSAGGKVDSVGGPCVGTGVTGAGVAVNSGVRGTTRAGPLGPYSDETSAAGPDVTEPEGFIVTAGGVPGTLPSKLQDAISPTNASSVTNTAVPEKICSRPLGYSCVRQEILSQWPPSHVTFPAVAPDRGRQGAARTSWRSVAAPCAHRPSRERKLLGWNIIREEQDEDG